MPPIWGPGKKTEKNGTLEYAWQLERENHVTNCFFTYRRLVSTQYNRIFDT